VIKELSIDEDEEQRNKLKNFSRLEIKMRNILQPNERKTSKI